MGSTQAAFFLHLDASCMNCVSNGYASYILDCPCTCAICEILAVQYIIYRIFDLIGLHATRYYKAANIIAGRHFSGAAGEEISWIGLEDFTLRSGFLTPKAGKFLLKVYTHLTKCQVHASICLGLSFQGAQYVVNVHAIGGASEWSYGHGFLCRQPCINFNPQIV